MPVSAGGVERVAVGCGTSIAPKLCSIHAHLRHSNELRAHLGLSPMPYSWIAERYPWRRDAVLTTWTQRHRRLLLRWLGVTVTPWLHDPWYSSAMCVHHYEGAWNANTGNGYYGGMQFSLSTWAANGGTGRPDLATPGEQLRVAYRTWQASGWYPWPNTARICGLI